MNMAATKGSESDSCFLQTYLIKAGYDPANGARPMKRSISSLVEDPVADACLMEYIKGGDDVLIDLADEDKVAISNRTTGRQHVMTDS